MSDDAQVEITLVQGEDFACQMFWTDDYNQPIPVAGPILMDVKDGYGQIAMRFLSSNPDATAPRINVNGPTGFFQLTAPRTVTAELIPGRYVFDLFASVADSAAPFPRQQQQLLTGYIVVEPRVSIVEDVAELSTAQGVQA